MRAQIQKVNKWLNCVEFTLIRGQPLHFYEHIKSIIKDTLTLPDLEGYYRPDVPKYNDADDYFEVNKKVGNIVAGQTCHEDNITETRILDSLIGNYVGIKEKKKNFYLNAYEA